MWELDHKEKLSTEELIVLNCGAGVFLECPLESKEIKPVSPKGNQSWIFIGRTDAEAEAPILWPPDVNNWLIWKDPDAGKDWGFEEKGTMQDEMVGWHHRLDGHEFDQASGFDYGQESLAWCRVRRDWATELNLTVFYTIWFYFHHQTHLHLSVIFALAQSLHPFWSNLQLSSALPQQHIRHLPAWGVDSVPILFNKGLCVGRRCRTWHGDSKCIWKCIKPRIWIEKNNMGGFSILFIKTCYKTTVV